MINLNEKELAKIKKLRNLGHEVIEATMALNKKTFSYVCNQCGKKNTHGNPDRQKFQLHYRISHCDFECPNHFKEIILYTSVEDSNE